MSEQSVDLLQNLPLHMALEAVNFPVNPVGRKIELSYCEKGIFREDTVVEQIKGLKRNTIYMISTVLNVEFRTLSNTEAMLEVYFKTGCGERPGSITRWFVAKDGVFVPNEKWEIMPYFVPDPPMEPWKTRKTATLLFVLCF